MSGHHEEDEEDPNMMEDILLRMVMAQSMNTQNNSGPPPAAQSFINDLPYVEIMKKHGEVACSVCRETFSIGDEARQMPCKHLFHDTCLFPWLKLHNSCPMCRHELPTLDHDYEERKREQMEKKAPAKKKISSPDLMYL